MTDTNDTLRDIFGGVKPSTDTILLSLVADVSTIKQAGMETNRRLNTIEKVIANVDTLSQQVSVAQAANQSNAISLARLETRCETIDKNVDSLGTHDIRIKYLEENLIKNGELRLSKIEIGRTKLLTYIIGILGTIGSSLLAFFFPLIKAHFS